MTDVDRNEYWLLKHADGRHIIIARQPENYGPEVIKWVEAKEGEDLRKGAWGLGIYAAGKPGDEIARLLERFGTEGYSLVSVRTPLSATVLKLLRELDELDDGFGVGSKQTRNGWRLDGGSIFSRHTFRKLDGLGLINPGNGHDDPVKILPVGRDLARYTRKRVTARLPIPTEGN